MPFQIVRRSTIKLDIFNHIFPKGYYEKMMEVNPNYKDIGNGSGPSPSPMIWTNDSGS